MNTPSHRLVLRDLSLPTRLTLSAFLISVGIGYFSALVQLHFQHASAGNLLPTPEETKGVYHGSPGMSQLERLLVADESKPFNGGGTMRRAFFTKSAGWAKATKNKTKEEIDKLRSERDGEALAFVEWIHAGLPKAAYDDDKFQLSTGFATKPISGNYLVKDDEDKPVSPRQVKIKTLIEDRCACCHAPDKTSIAAKFPLDTYEDVALYSDKSAGGMSLAHLAQTTHVHLLGFSMLFGLTGVIFSLTNYPGFIRGLFAPLTLVAQVVDVACWWLSRADPMYTQLMLATGGLVALGLLIHILGSLIDMYGKSGKLILFLLILLTGCGAIATKSKIIDPYLERERRAPEVREVNVH
jgi:hypothetical protein